MSAEDFEQPDNVGSLDIPKLDWGVGFEPVTAGDDFFLEECPVGDDVVMWYLALPGEFDDLQSLGRIPPGDTYGGRRSTRFSLIPTATIYNRFTSNEDDLSEDYDQIHGYLIGVHECMYDRAYEENGPGESKEIAGVEVFDPTEEWDQEIDSSIYKRDGGISLNEAVVYRIDRLDGVPDSFTPVDDMIKPLEQFGVENRPIRPANEVEITDSDERGRIKTLLAEKEDPRERVSSDVQEFASGGPTDFSSLSGSGSEGGGGSDPAGGGSSETAESGDRSEDSSSESDDEDDEVAIPSTPGEIEDMAFSELQKAASALDIGSEMIGASAGELRDLVRGAAPLDGPSEGSGGGDDGDDSLSTTFDVDGGGGGGGDGGGGGGGGGGGDRFSDVNTSAAVEDGTILIRHEISGNGVSEVSESPDFDPESIKQDVEQKVMENVDRQVQRMDESVAEASGGGEESESPEVVPDTTDALMGLSYNELQQAGSALGLGSRMSGADTDSLREMVAEVAIGLDPGDLPDDESSSEETGGSDGDDVDTEPENVPTESGGSSSASLSGAGDDPPFPPGQQILLTSTSCIDCQELKQQAEIQQMLETGALIEVNETFKPQSVFTNIVDAAGGGSAPLLVLWDGEEYVVQESP